ncbi:ArsR family transcriptional regulator [Marinobacter lipolyticus SM19]|uniref:ArsR family transcriptional regulator n=2 Tax=Marinobacter lipolyticus TaxID=209639 RepID=R8AZU9_9GAMM|nr:ArsR family transcriptional regulator [Marinobacter lipolyticus SM19]
MRNTVANSRTFKYHYIHFLLYMVISMSSRRRVLFVCTANSARSLMAEALLRDMAGDHFDVASAGTEPAQPHPLALQCIREAGINPDTVHSKSLSCVSDEKWDYVITLCDKASQECHTIGETAQRIAWDFPDPVPTNRHAAFSLLMKELRERLSLFVMVHQKATSQAVSYDPAAVFKALGDENRLAIMLMIRQQSELCVCELTTALDASQPKVSRHLAQLRELALLDDERRGQWVYYRLHPAIPDWVLDVLRDTADANIAFQQPFLTRLATMPDRPVKMDCV